MKKITFVFLISLLFFSTLTRAAWLENVPQIITQPDGNTIQCFASGDEFYNWLHDKNGYTIIRDHKNGYYTYAILQDNELKPSEFIVGKVDPSEMGLIPGANISAEAMKKIRLDFFNNYMPEKKPLPGFKNPGTTKNTGSLNNLVVYIRFSDQAEFVNDTLVFWNMFNNQATGYNSLYNYYQMVSYQQLNISSTFYPLNQSDFVISYQDIYPRSYFMPYDATTNPDGYQNSDQKKEREHKLLKRAVIEIKDEVQESLNIDYNNDGYVDNVAFIIRGEATAWSTLLWPHRWALYSEYVYIHGKRVYDYNFQIEERLFITGVGVLCHEMFHSLGAPDLYHYDTNPIDPVEDWDIMGKTTDPPRSMGAYMKYRYGGWIEDIPEITECGTYSLNPISSQGNNCFKISSPNSSTDYFVLEYRIKEGVFESVIPNSGLLIYKVNTLEDGNGNGSGPPDELYVYRPNGTLEINGNITSAVFSADYGRTEFNDNTNPSCFLSNGQDGGIFISNIGIIDDEICFDVNFEKEPVANFAASSTTITENCSIDFEDSSLCQVNTREWFFEGGTPEVSTDQFPTGIFYENAGTYDVSLTVSNDWGQNTITLSDYINVSTTALPVADFSSSNQAICSGSVVSFEDKSEICPLSWEWEIIPNSGVEFVNGTSSTTQNIDVAFNEIGEFSVKLTVENANGTDEIIKSNYIKSGGIPISGSWGETFDYSSMDNSEWRIVNPDNDVCWEIFDIDGSTSGTKAAGIQLFEYMAFNQRDQLISPVLNMNSPESSCFLTFKYAYTTTNPNYTDSLIIKISHDCGESWTRVFAIGEDGTQNFITREMTEYSFTPVDQEDWCSAGFGAQCYTIELPDCGNKPNTQIMFESASIIGNNLYIDDISIDILEGVYNIPEKKQISIFPNPSTGILTLSSLHKLDVLDASVYNQQGQLIKRLNINSIQPRQPFSFDLSGFVRGVYFLKVTGNDFLIMKKIVLEN